MIELTDSQISSMKKVGFILTLLGVADLTYCAVTSIQSGNFSTPTSILTIAAGILVFRKNLDAARIIVWIFSFIFGTLVLVPIMLLDMPWRLVWLQLSQAGAMAVFGVLAFLVFGAMVFWIRSSLARLPIGRDGGPARPLYRSVAAAIGALIPVLILVFMISMTGGESGKRAIEKARNSTGPGYEYYIKEMSVSDNSGSAVVLAYSDTEIIPVVVHWSE